MAFTATYRTGQGLAGNVGAGAIAHVVTDDARLAGVRNLMPARGGTEPETAEQIRRRAPEAFRTQERAVTPEDYAAVASRMGGVQRAAATPRWTGSWHTMFVTVDRLGGAPMTRDDRERAESFVEPYRMAGYDVAFNDPVHVPLELGITICVLPDHFRSHVHAALLEVLSNRALPDGRRGLFHPDAFTFGQPVHLSPIYAAVRGVPGVETAEVTRFQRQGQPDAGAALRSGQMRLGRLEVARLDNDRNFPERGVLRLSLHGGK
jgi:predicted phage baseplate assembly protein